VAVAANKDMTPLRITDPDRKRRDFLFCCPDLV
jgi:hypothetical protein